MLAGNSGYDPNFDASLSYGNDPANIRGGLDAINSPAYPPARSSHDRYFSFQQLVHPAFLRYPALSGIQFTDRSP